MNEHIERWHEGEGGFLRWNDDMRPVTLDDVRTALTSSYNAGLERAKEVAHEKWYPKDRLGEEYFVDVLPEELITAIDKEKNEWKDITPWA